jgi:hypothetical protein
MASVLPQAGLGTVAGCLLLRLLWLSLVAEVL